MTPPTTDIAALLGSRICHDLISPIGAISNGVELLTMSGASTLPEIDLIAQSVEHANARIGFFRIAFGAASPEQRMGEAEVRQVLANVTRGSRLEVAWATGGDAPRPEVKLAFLLVNCLETALPRGGRIEVSRAGQGWRLTAQAESLRMEPRLWDLLPAPDPDAEVAASEVQFLLAPQVAASIDRRLAVASDDKGLTITFQARAD